MLAALVLPVLAVCFVLGLVFLLERPRRRTISLTERRPPRATRPPSSRALRSVGDEAEEWLHKHA